MTAGKIRIPDLYLISSFFYNILLSNVYFYYPVFSSVYFLSMNVDSTALFIY